MSNFEFVVPQTVANMVRYERTVLKVGVDLFMRLFHRNLFLTANVTTWLFDGIDDPVLDIASRFPEVNIPFDKFGWFYDVSSHFYNL